MDANIIWAFFEKLFQWSSIWSSDGSWKQPSILACNFFKEFELKLLYPTNLSDTICDIGHLCWYRK